MFGVAVDARERSADNPNATPAVTYAHVMGEIIYDWTVVLLLYKKKNRT